MKNNHTFVSIFSLTWDKAVILYSLGQVSRVRIEETDPPGEALAETVEENSFGQLHLTNLKPGRQYRLVFKWLRGRRSLQFKTLPKPSGELLRAFVACADLHISTRNENRKGRLLVESAMILREIVEHCNTLKLSFVLVAGDLTNDGTAADYRLLERTLGLLKCPLLAVPGDHDLLGAGARHWRKYFGPKSWTRKDKKFGLTGLDTGKYVLGRDNLRLLTRSPDDNRVSLIVSHCQLIPDDYIISDGKCVKDYDKYRQQLEEIMQSPRLIYVGHQNVGSRITVGKSVQINLPQPVQFPCGYLLVRQYDNGIYHTFMPIRSQALAEYSRVAANQAADHYQEPQWQDHYRLGTDVSTWNCFHKTEDFI